MERKQGFFSTLREEVARGLTPSRSSSRGRSRSESPCRVSSSMAGRLLSRRWKNHRLHPPHLTADPPMATLEPLMEGPDPGGEDVESGRNDWWGHWMRGRLSRGPTVSASSRRSDIGLLLGVMGTPLAPIHVSAADPLPHLSIKDTPIETSSAQYILHQYTGASILQQRTGSSAGLKLQSSIQNSYATGKVRMVASEFETASKVVKNRNASRDAVSGSFVLWQMAPDKWYVELAVGGSKVHAGCNGQLIWRHTPWLGSHATKGPVRPLRRALQGLDPLTTASMFANAQCIGEKTVNRESCFVLKISADPKTLKARSEGPVEIIRHFLFGYFSQKTGLLVRMEDSHLTRIQSMVAGDVDYWETTINSFLDDYRPVEGIMVAHSGRSIVTLFRFSEVAMGHTKTMLEEEWTIEEVAFNVHGLSMDCFIPPADIKRKSISEARELPQVERGKTTAGGSFRAKVAALEKPFDNDDDGDGNTVWGLEV